MAGRRWGISSPVFYSVLLVCGLAGLYYGVELVGPRIVRWVEQWRLSRGMRSADPRSRLGAVARHGRQRSRPDESVPRRRDRRSRRRGPGRGVSRAGVPGKHFSGASDLSSVKGRGGRQRPRFASTRRRSWAASSPEAR